MTVTYLDDVEYIDTSAYCAHCVTAHDAHVALYRLLAAHGFI